MILIKMKSLLYLLGIILFFSFPFLVLILNVDQTHIKEMDIGLPFYLLPVLFVLEILIYFFFGSLAGTSLSTTQLVEYSMIMAVFRFALCLIGAMVFSSFQAIPHTTAIQILWAGNPLLILLQVFLLMMFGPYLILVFFPGLMGEKEHLYLSEVETSRRMKPLRSVRSESIPLGGFIRVYGFLELGRLFSNLIGIEGYILYTWEGLVLWQDCQLRLDMEKVVSCFMKEWDCHRVNDLAIGFDEPLRIVTQTNEHSFIHVMFNRDFSGIFIFRPDAHMSEILGRMKYLDRTAREFLATRYPPVG